MSTEHTSHPDGPEPIGLTEDARRAVQIAAGLSGGRVTTTHLLIGILDVGGGGLGRALAGVDVDLSALAARLREALPEPPGGAGEPALSPNTRRILTAAAERARRKSRQAATVDDLVDAALRTGAGAMGRLITELVELAGQPEQPSADDQTHQVSLSGDAQGLWERAVACARQCEPPLLGSPQLLAAALHGEESLRDGLRLQGLDADDLLTSLFEALSLPESDGIFDAVADAHGPSVSHNIHRVLSEAEARGEKRGIGGAAAQDVVLALLHNETAEAHGFLERHGVHVGLLCTELTGRARALERTDDSPDP